MAVTNEEIIAACEQIARSGLDTTQQTVRELTGGSYSTIGPILKKWKEQRQNDDRVRDIPVPDVIGDASAVMTGKLWEAALEHATAGHEAMRKALLAAEVAAAVERDESTAIIAELEGDLEATRSNLKTALERLDRLEAEREGNFRRVADAQVIAEHASTEAATLRMIIDARDTADRKMPSSGVSLEKPSKPKCQRSNALPGSV
ncbi:DNA-binding protein [Jannaschia pohangensis]|uniref:Replication region DNA-binding N-term n=1 Tax=Jannaschia pohangensis TaxID=390807 RepID=A0A1I3MYX7_9RHOB|nr:DNA-binding protein [Jannaschia pohangensis]SFJ01975.1 replication region DNA-binding N-term [Jannaschia pohangensis]